MALTRSKCIPNWKKCESCQTILDQNKFDLHAPYHCPPTNLKSDWTYGHIFDKKLFSFLKIFEPQDKNELFFNDVIQVSLSIAQLCDFAIGDPVVITAKNNRCIVKPLWPLEDNVLSSVFLTKQSLWELNCFEGAVEVKKMEKPPSPAKIVYLKWIKPESMSESQISEIVYILSAYFNNKILVKGQHLLFNFYGQRPKLEVISINPFRAAEDEIETLNDEFADIKLEDKDDEKFFKILPNTKWKIKNLDDEEHHKSCCEKYCLSKLGGMDCIISELKDVMYNILASDYIQGQSLSCGLILHGVSGTGKTYLANSMINNTKLPVVHISSWQIFSKYFGEAENRVKALFEEAMEKAPSIILIDELDTFCPGRTGSDQEKRVLGVLLSMLDKLNDFKVVVLGITRHLDSVDAALRRPGRFDYEIEIPVPDVDARIDILSRQLLSYHHVVSNDVISQIGKIAHGFVGSDLSLVCTLANTRVLGNCKIKSTGLEEAVISEDDLLWAFSQVKPSAMREILVEVPDVKWSDIGGQEDMKLKLQQVLEWPLKHPEAFTRLGLTAPRGVLLFGPPGCSKTMIAKAVATESKLNFISVKGAELFSKWVGDSEKAIREVFRKARTVSPSVIFFDEIDAISAERDTDGSSGSNVQERVLSQLLTEMDGIQPLNNVTVIAATNRPDRIDSALLRPGRLDRKLYVPLPDEDTRKAILALQFTKTPINEDVKLQYLVKRTEGYSGAEVVAMCHEAAIKALQDSLSAERVNLDHFEHALDVVRRQTPKSLLKIYDKFLENK